jgi:hypothetical protein
MYSKDMILDVNANHCVAKRMVDIALLVGLSHKDLMKMSASIHSDFETKNTDVFSQSVDEEVVGIIKAMLSAIYASVERTNNRLASLEAFWIAEGMTKRKL